MNNLDELIDEALDAEERELLRAIGEEPGFVERAMGLFGAGVGWMVFFMMMGQALLSLAGVWAAWGFFEASDPFTQLRWGLPAAVLLLASLAVKLAVAPPIHTNQIMRELKRIELRIVRARQSEGGTAS